MDVTQALDELRAEHAGCDLVAFTDLSSAMVLCVSADTRPKQEDLDALSAAAAALLTGEVAQGSQPMIGADDDAAGVAMTMTSAGTRLFLRAPDGSSEALICLCAPGADLPEVTRAGRDALARISAAG